MRDFTPASYHERLQREWFRDLDEADWRLFPRRTEEERATRYVSDCERAVCTILEKTKTYHPLLQVLVRRYIENQACIDSLPEIDAVPIKEWQRLYKRGWEVDDGPTVEQTREWLDVLQREGYGTLNGEMTYPDMTDEPNERLQIQIEFEEGMDRATLHLLHALARHRSEGEEGEETMVGLGYGVGFITSLPAALAEYHQAMRSVFYRTLEEERVLSDDRHRRMGRRG